MELCFNVILHHKLGTKYSDVAISYVHVGCIWPGGWRFLTSGLGFRFRLCLRLGFTFRVYV